MVTEEEKLGAMLGRTAVSPQGIEPGLSKRELFAAMAMQGMCATDWTASRIYDFAAMAQDAVGAADALLKELAK